MLADTLSNRPRTVRVRFRDADGDAPRAETPVRAEVDAIIWRRLNPGWRIDTETTLGNNISRDPALIERGVNAATPVPLTRDDRFAGELARRIARRLDALLADRSADRSGHNDTP